MGGQSAIGPALLKKTVAAHEVAVLERAEEMAPPSRVPEHRRRDAIKEALTLWNSCLATTRKEGRPMQIAISSRKTVVTPRLEEVIRDKIGRLDKFLEGMDHAEVHLSEEKNPRLADRKELCEVSMSGHGHRVRCKVSAPDS